MLFEEGWVLKKMGGMGVRKKTQPLKGMGPESEHGRKRTLVSCPASAQPFTRGFTVPCLCIHRLELLQLAIMLTGQMRGGLTMLAELSRRGEFGVKSKASRQQHACPLQFLSVFSE